MTMVKIFFALNKELHANITREFLFQITYMILKQIIKHILKAIRRNPSSKYYLKFGKSIDLTTLTTNKILRVDALIKMKLKPIDYAMNTLLRRSVYSN